MRAPRIRTMREFVEQELILPSGQHEGRKFKCERNPFTRLWFDEVDSGRWKRHVATGPTGSGKTIIGFVAPILYHLFEIGETVLCGLPNLDIVKDKWSEDLLPAIERSRFRELLPRLGQGSRGGDVKRVQFRNGATLRFMTGGGGDKSRAHFHCRILVVTETDGLDEVGGGSRETDKLKQLEARVSSFPNSRSFFECTVSTEHGRTWQEYQNGTQSRVAIRCPYCEAFVTPEREHLIGWKEASDPIQAAENTRMVCPSCGHQWGDLDRDAANRECRLVHAGQMIESGHVAGAPPRTDTFGFRWTAANNLLIPMGIYGQREFKATREKDEVRAETEMRQFVWALPSEPQAIDLTGLDWQLIVKRTTGEAKGYIPDDAEHVVIGIDVGKRLCYWEALAIRRDGSPHVFDYGRIEVASDDIGEDRALLAALRDFREQFCNRGWQSKFGPRCPDVQMVDAGYLQEIVFEFCRESGPDWIPVKGFGFDQRRDYTDPRKKDDRVSFVGDGYYISRLPSKRIRLCHVDADRRKSWFHARLQTPMGHPGALTLYDGLPSEHTSIAKHYTAERQEEIFVPGKGKITVFKVLHRNNHWLDAGAIAGVAAHYAANRISAGTGKTPSPADAADTKVSKWSSRGGSRWKS